MVEQKKITVRAQRLKKRVGDYLQLNRKDGELVSQRDVELAMLVVRICMQLTRQTHSTILGLNSSWVEIHFRLLGLSLWLQGAGFGNLWAPAERAALGGPGPSKAALHEDTGDRCLERVGNEAVRLHLGGVAQGRGVLPASPADMSEPSMSNQTPLRACLARGAHRMSLQDLLGLEARFLPDTIHLPNSCLGY